MSAGEIEDVLSSIRRLVSDELRPMARTPAPQPEAKLLLTPSLRVVAAEPEQIDDEAVAQEPQPAATEEPSEGRLNIISSVQSFGAEADEESDVTQIEGFVFQARRSAVSTYEPEILQDPSDSDDFAEAEAEVLFGEVVPEIEPPVPTPEAWAQEAPYEEVHEDLASAEEALADAAPEGAFRPEADPDWIRAAEAEVMAALAGGSARQGAQASAPSDDNDDDASLFGNEARYDETLLRDLVRDLIREELQGSLGERITRNVRKLVRVEVARALSLHDLE